MRCLKKILFFSVIILMCICLIMPYLIGQWMLKKVPEYLSITKQYGINLAYQNATAPFCFLCVKLVANKTEAYLLNQSIDLGNVTIQMPIWDWRLFYFDFSPIDRKQNYLKATGCFKKGNIQVSSMQTRWDNLETNLAGYINLNNKVLSLKGQASNLLDFINPYVPKAVSVFLPLVIKNTAQDIEIDTYQQYLRVNKVPILNLIKF